METIEQLRFWKSNSDFTLVQLLYVHNIIYVKNKNKNFTTGRSCSWLIVDLPWWGFQIVGSLSFMTVEHNGNKSS